MDDRSPEQIEKEEHLRAVEARIKHAVRLTREDNYDDAIGIFEKNLPSLTSGDIQSKRSAASNTWGSSFAREIPAAPRPGYAIF